MNAIETRYAGCRFRSRLEARWAVFFDALDTRWIYEGEGFQFGKDRYLPDFYIPEWKAWVEIKATPPNLRESDLCGKLWQARREHKERVLLIAGQPWLGEYDLHLVVPVDGEPTCEGGYVFGERDGYETDLWIVCDWAEVCLNRRDRDRDNPERPDTTGPRLSLAYERARGARFEHGETP